MFMSQFLLVLTAPMDRCQAELAWVTGYTPRWFTHLLTITDRYWPGMTVITFVDRDQHVNHYTKPPNGRPSILKTTKCSAVTVASSCRSASTAFSRLVTNSSTYWYRNFLRARHSRAFCRLSSMRFAESMFSGLRPRFLPLCGATETF